MTKYMVTSGFLGAGKTTAMIAFARNINGRGLGHAAILANDLGSGNIVDAEFTAAAGITTLPIPGNCICYQHENLVDKLHQLEAAGADALDVSCGNYFTKYGENEEPYSYAQGWRKDNTRKVKEAVNIPVIGLMRKRETGKV